MRASASSRSAAVLVSLDGGSHAEVRRCERARAIDVRFAITSAIDAGAIKALRLCKIVKK